MRKTRKVLLEEIEEMLPNVHHYLGYLTANCVFHQDSHPSMFIYQYGYHCKACGKSGTLQELHAFLTKGGFTAFESQFRPLRWTEFYQQEFDPEEFATQAHLTLRKFPELGIYLKRRGVETAINPCKLGYVDGWYTFPIFDPNQDICGLVAGGGQVVRSLTEFRYVTPRGQSPLLYVPSWSRIKRSEFVLVTFGIMDALTLFILGYPVATGSVGKEIDPHLFDDIRKPIYVIPDTGEYKSAVQLATALQWRGHVLQLEYPHGKDCNDTFTAGGEDWLRDTIDDALLQDPRYSFSIRT